MKVWCQIVIQLTLFQSTLASSSRFYEIPTHCGNNSQVNDSYRMSVLSSKSIIQCSVACQQDPRCYSFVYQDKECGLYAMILLNDCSTAVAKTKKYYFEKAGCLNGGLEISRNNCQCNDGYIAEKCYRLQYDCNEGFGVYPEEDLRLLIQPSPSVQPFHVQCQMKYKGRTYILYQVSPHTNLTRPWIDYKQGFGSIQGDHWLGLDHLYSIVNGRAARGISARLTFETRIQNDAQFQQHYSNFLIGNQSENYEIKLVGSYSGSLGDCMTDLIGATFATYDYGGTNGRNCATQYGGGWWFSNTCARCNPVGHIPRPDDGMRLNVTYEKFWPGLQESPFRVKVWIE